MASVDHPLNRHKFHLKEVCTIQMATTLAVEGSRLSMTVSQKILSRNFSSAILFREKSGEYVVHDIFPPKSKTCVIRKKYSDSKSRLRSEPVSISL